MMNESCPKQSRMLESSSSGGWQMEDDDDDDYTRFLCILSPMINKAAMPTSAHIK